MAQYTIKKGDTLWAIAKANNISLNELARLNPTIKDLNKIQINQKINIPDAKTQVVEKEVKVTYPSGRDAMTGRKEPEVRWYGQGEDTRSDIPVYQSKVGSTPLHIGLAEHPVRSFDISHYPVITVTTQEEPKKETPAQSTDKKEEKSQGSDSNQADKDTIKQLQQQLAQKDKEIARLNAEITELRKLTGPVRSDTSGIPFITN